MTKRMMGMTVAASMALFATPAFGEPPSAAGGRDPVADAKGPGDEARPLPTRSDAIETGDRQYADDAPAPGAGSGEPEAAARERALQAEQEREFVERVWTGP